MENLASGNQTWQAEKYIVDIPLPCLINRGVVNLSLKSMRKMLFFFFAKMMVSSIRIHVASFGKHVNKPLVFWQTNISGKTKNKSTQIIH
jgi:hypothetical protein